MIGIDLAYNLHSCFGNWFPGVKPLTVQVIPLTFASRSTCTSFRDPESSRLYRCTLCRQVLGHGDHSALSNP